MAKKYVGFTLVELLTVIALIIIIAAVAVPNFAAMIREQRWTSAISSIQTAIMRARTYAVNKELDHAVEFCTAPDGSTYLRIEAESAFLEHMPNLQEYLNLSDTLLAMPLTWYHTFISRRDAWGTDGNRLFSGVWDCLWVTGGFRYGTGWGHIYPNTWYEHGEGSSSPCHLSYDERYPHDKASITWPWANYRFTLSIDERTNVAGDADGTYDPGDGYMDVNDDYIYTYQSTEWAASIRDNLVVDDMLYLPHDIRLDLNHAQSNLINFDVAKNGNKDVVRHGWDGTPDLRFGKSGHLLQAQTPEIVITRQGKGGTPDQHMRLRLLRGTGRLKKVN